MKTASGGPGSTAQHHLRHLSRAAGTLGTITARPGQTTMDGANWMPAPRQGDCRPQLPGGPEPPRSSTLRPQLLPHPLSALNPAALQQLAQGMHRAVGCPAPRECAWVSKPQPARQLLSLALSQPRRPPLRRTPSCPLLTALCGLLLIIYPVNEYPRHTDEPYPGGIEECMVVRRDRQERSAAIGGGGDGRKNCVTRVQRSQACSEGC